MLGQRHRQWANMKPALDPRIVFILVAPAVTVGETEGAIDSASVPIFTSSFAYNLCKKLS